MLSILIFSSSDPVLPDADHSRGFQQSMVSRLIDSGRMPAEFQRTIRGLNADPDDLCSWPFVQCAEGCMTALCSIRQKFRYIMKWMPSTVQHIHIYEEYAEPIKTRALPRDLRYLYSHSQTRGYPYALDLKQLPSKLEELIIRNHLITGIVILTHLPSTLRLIYITSALPRTTSTENNQILHVFVDSGSLTKSFSAAYFMNPPACGLQFGRISIKHLGHGKLDKRVHRRHSEPAQALLRKESVYFANIVDKYGE